MIDPVTGLVIAGAYVAGKYLAKDKDEVAAGKSPKPAPKKLPSPPTEPAAPPEIKLRERMQLVTLEGDDVVFRPEVAAKIRETLERAGVENAHAERGMVSLRLVPTRQGRRRASDVVRAARERGHSVYASYSTALLRGECMVLLVAKGRTFRPEHFALLPPEPPPVEVVKPEVVRRKPTKAELETSGQPLGGAVSGPIASGATPRYVETNGAAVKNGHDPAIAVNKEAEPAPKASEG